MTSRPFFFRRLRSTCGLLPLATLGCLGAGVLYAQEAVTVSPDYVSLLPGYSLPSKAYGTTGHGATVSGVFGHEFSPRLAVELNIQSSTFETGINGGTDFYQNGATIDVAYGFGDRNRKPLLTPFVLGGLGVVYDDFYPNNRDGIAFLAEAGVGLVSRPLFSRLVRLRIDARYARDGKEGGRPEGRLLAGFEIPLGRIETRVAVREPAP